MSNNCIQSVKDRLVVNYRIPTYQRGYRWGEDQINDLISDLEDFYDSFYLDKNVDKKDYYCLQAMIVQEKSKNEYIIIDGQQRLTTMYILLSLMIKKKDYKFNELGQFFFDTRSDTGDVLAKLRTNGITSVNVVSRDIAHIVKAYEIFETAFENNDLYKKIEFLIDNNKVRFIVQDITKSKYDEIEVFENINIGKIRLTDAELIRAKLLVKIKDENLRNEIATEWDEIEHSLQDDSFWYFIQDNRDDSASRIDFIFYTIARNITEIIKADKEAEKKLNSNEAKKKEMQASVKALKRDGNNNFHELYRFFESYNLSGDLSLRDGIFNDAEKTIIPFWKKVKEYYETLYKWYGDIELYNYIGIVLYIGGRDNSIHALSNLYKEKNRYLFIEELKTRILCSFDRDVTNIWPHPDPAKEPPVFAAFSTDQAFKTLWYDGRGSDTNSNQKRVMYFLLWSNCEYLNSQMRNTNYFIDNQAVNNSYRFLFDVFKSRKADIEHVDSYMNTEDIEDLDNDTNNMRDIWIDNIKDIVSYDKDIASDQKSKDKANELINELNNNSNFKELIKKVKVYFNENENIPLATSVNNIESIHIDKRKIGNLTLLDPNINRGYKNSPFRVKRKDIISKSSAGVYVYPCTKMVFLKEFNPMSIDLVSWNEKDYQEYWNKLCEMFFDCFFIDQKQTDAFNKNIKENYSGNERLTRLTKKYCNRIYNAALNKK